MGIIAFIILGLLAGLIAKAIMPGNDPGGFIMTAIIGMVGALLGGFLAGALFDADPHGRVLRYLDLADGDRRLDHPPRAVPRHRRIGAAGTPSSEPERRHERKAHRVELR